LPPQVAGSDHLPDCTLLIVVAGKKDSDGAQAIEEVLRTVFFFAPMDDAKNKPAAVSELLRIKFLLVFFTRLFFWFLNKVPDKASDNEWDKKFGFILRTILMPIASEEEIGKKEEQKKKEIRYGKKCEDLQRRGNDQVRRMKKDPES
jgi:hypothetical protein